MKKIIILLGFLGILGGTMSSVFAGYFSSTVANRCNVEITSTLQIGSENNEVYALQATLARGGYLFVNPNGYFGPSTKAAVKRFQIANGVYGSGIVGEETRNALNERLCDLDVQGEAFSYDSYGYNNATTYVDQYDPYAKVILPPVANPVVYATPQNNILPLSSSVVSVRTTSSIPSSLQNISAINSLTTGSVASQVQSAGIIYNPTVGYTYGITQKAGSLTVASPLANTVYLEGDTVVLRWVTDNIQTPQFQILLENTSTSQSRQITVIQGNNTSFILTKELLDAVCSGTCNNNQQGSFRIVIASQVTDIAGIVSTFRAAVSPITVRRPYSVTAPVTLTASKIPVNSGEAFKLYVNIASVEGFDLTSNGNATVKIRATCVNNVQASIAGVPCGQDFTMPASVATAQQGVPVMLTNTTWYKQDVIFEVAVYNLHGQMVGTSKVTTSVNQAPFSW